MIPAQQRRLYVVVILMALIAVAIIFRLISFQVVRDDELAEIGHSVQVRDIIARPARGIIYDSKMAVLAGNGNDYQIGVSPTLVLDSEEMSADLAAVLDESRRDILLRLDSDRPYELLAGRVSAKVAEALQEVPYDGLQIDPLPRRIYPQGELMCHVLGYTDFEGAGGSGIEGRYDSELAGYAASATINISPLTTQESVIPREGADIVLTVDRTIQYVVEEHLKEALETHQAESGTIIVMNPRTGAILAMANLPCYSPYEFYDADEALLLNPAVSEQYEPGSVMKLITMAAALDSGTVTPHTTYNDTGTIVLGGHPIYNWDRSSRGVVDMEYLLANSLNVGAATIATWMGTDTFYNYFQRFGYGRPTGVDILAEAGGQLPLPGSPNWTEINLGTNSFGQGMATTPLQMISSVSAIANDGFLMKPFIVKEIHYEDQIVVNEPTVLSRPITEETAHQVSAMAVNAVRTEVFGAQIEGYTVAGKTGTAQIPEGGIYHPTDTIGSFIGWLPADAPELIILVKLDRPQSSPWGSTTAAPVFADLARDLVALLDIPPDRLRLQQDIMEVRGN